MEPALLAVDLGLRTGFAFLSRDGTLLRHGSKHYGSRTTLRRGADGMLAEASSVTHLVIEGGGEIAEVWERAASKRGLTVRRIAAEAWRPTFLSEHEQRDGPSAKAAALRLAERVVTETRSRGPRPPRHDAAEAILAGLWQAVQLGWLHRPPAGLPVRRTEMP